MFTVGDGFCGGGGIRSPLQTGSSSRDSSIAKLQQHPPPAGPALHLGNMFQEKSETAGIVIARSFFDPKDQSGPGLGCDAKQRGDEVMSPRRFAILATALCGTVILVGSVIAAVGSFGLADMQEYPHSANDRVTETAKTGGSETIAASAAQGWPQ